MWAITRKISYRNSTTEVQTPGNMQCYYFFISLCLTFTENETVIDSQSSMVMHISVGIHISVCWTFKYRCTDTSRGWWDHWHCLILMSFDCNPYYLSTDGLTHHFTWLQGAGMHVFTRSWGLILVAQSAQIRRPEAKWTHELYKPVPLSPQK